MKVKNTKQKTKKAPTPSGNLLVQCYHPNGGYYEATVGDEYGSENLSGPTSTGWNCQVSSVE